MQSLLKKIIVVSGVALIAAGVWWWRAHPGEKLSFTTDALKRGNVSATISATGTIEPLEVVDVGAQVAGRVSVLEKMRRERRLIMVRS